MRERSGLPLALLARDIYSYLHIPLTLGIILAALGIKLTLGHPHDPLPDVAAVALGGGVAGYFAALAGIRLRIGLRPTPAQVGATVAALAVIPLATEVSATVSLGVLAAVTMAAAVTEYLTGTDSTDPGTDDDGKTPAPAPTRAPAPPATPTT